MSHTNELCEACGKPIGMLDPSYYVKGADDDIGKTYHARCAPRPLDPYTVEACANVEVEPDVATVADAQNPFQEGYAVGFQDCEARFRAAIRALIHPEAAK